MNYLSYYYSLETLLDTLGPSRHKVTVTAQANKMIIHIKMIIYVNYLKSLYMKVCRLSFPAMCHKFGMRITWSQKQWKPKDSRGDFLPPLQPTKRI